jgi:hypothetical protein
VKAGLLVLCALAVSGCTIQPLVRSSAPQPSDRLSLLPPNAVPTAGKVEHVWTVPAGTTVPELVVGWSRRDPRCRLGDVNSTGYCHGLTIWRRSRPGHWMPTTLFRRSPFPFKTTSVRTADVTGDGHRDLLVTIECSACNHAAATATVYADVDGRVTRIYGQGSFDWSPVLHTPGQSIVETAWGARHGLVWFDEPHYGPHSSMCCPDYRVQKFLRWKGGRWHTVKTRRVAPGHAYLDQRPVPAP